LETSPVSPVVIDCDVHNVVPSVNTLIPYLPSHWQEYVNQSDLKGPTPDLYSPKFLTAALPEGEVENNPLPGSKLESLQQHVLDPLGVKIAILNCAYAAESVRNPYGAAAFASAVNDWQMAEWLEPEPRLRASLVVPSQDPELAAREIQRLGGRPEFVQVFLPVRSQALYGTRQYHPIYRAATEYNLAVAIHFGGAPGAPPSSSGWPSYYVEEYAGMSQIFQSQLISLIVEGVFEEFPSLKLVLAASGVTWLPAMLWRLDKEWKGLRREIPWVKRLPSEYVRQHVRLTLNPLDAPSDPVQLRQVIDQLESEELLLFSTDYPYQYFQNIDEALPAGLPANLKRKILYGNAQAFYEL
jgi:predicted TIM-barrel fold metal-dependent hydrolase